MRKLIIISGFLAAVVSVAYSQSPISVGSTVQTVTLKDGNDLAKNIPYLGEKVISVFYTDPDVKDINDALSNALKARKYPETKYQGVGVGNCADTWIPNAAIRMKAREKEKQFKGSVVLLDTDHVLAKAWGLKETNDAGVVIIIGIDKKVKFIRSIKKADESKAVINEVLGIIDTEIAK